MAYQMETIKKVLEKAQEIRKALDRMDANDIRLCISAGNRKIGRVMNVSLMPIVTCANCKECMMYCYDIKACAQYPDTVIDARMRNTVLLVKDRDAFFAHIDAKMSRRHTNKYFRWHVAGDIIDIDYFSRMVDNARKHPDFVIWTYTKCYDVVNRWIDENGKLPDNMHVMFSKWDGLPINNPYNMPIFACKMKAGNKDKVDFDSMWKCPGNCDMCKACNRGCIAGESSYADEH